MKHLHRMARTFGRPVTGIHCRTYGPIIDMMMAMMHPYMPSATGPAVTSTLRTSLLNTSTRKVIVLGHSTGCLPLNTSLDCLHADLPSVCMSKLEIYTFGSAARHMHNPLLVLDELSLPSIGISMPINGTNNSSSPTIGGIGDGRNRSRSPNPQWTRADGSIASPVKATLKSAGYRVEDLERVIPHIEHYAFESAMAARCGILEAVKGGRSRLAGRVFVLGSNEKKQMTNGNHAPVEAQSTMIWWSSMVTKLTAMAFDVPPLGGYSAMGTMDEYIDALFPCTTASSTSTLMSILDTIPSIDISTAERREFIAQSTAPPMLASRKLSFGLGLASPSSKSMTNGGLSPTMTNGNGITSRKDKRNSWNTSASLGIDGVGKARQCARESSGRTVRQLSRLWNYVNGKKPVGEGVALVNGVGNGVGMVDHMGKMMNGHGMQGNGMTNGGAMAMADMGMNGVKQEVMASA